LPATRTFDENGVLLFEVVRYDPKGFRQRRPDGHGGWIWKLGDTRRVLYQLPQVRHAVTTGDVIYIPEGERDVHALEKVGVVATCNPGGAGKWRPEYTAALAGAYRVVIVRDRDAPGRAHTQQVRDSLVGHVGEVIVVEPVVGKDAADHLGAGRTVEEFEIIDLDAADGDTSPDNELADWQPVDLGPEWRGEKIRPTADVFKRDDGLALLLPGVNGIHADSGDGKSILANIIALTELRAGWPVIWVTYEDANEELIIERLRQLGATWDEVARLHLFVADDALTGGAEQLAALTLEVGTRLLVLDSVGEAMAVGGVNEDRDNEVGPWFRRTLRRIHDLNPAVALGPSTTPPRRKTIRCSRRGRNGSGPPSPAAHTSATCGRRSLEVPLATSSPSSPRTGAARSNGATSPPRSCSTPPPSPTRGPSRHRDKATVSIRKCVGAPPPNESSRCSASHPSP
jgi:hypothetical protein